MASGLSSSLGLAGIIFIVIGIIMAVVGIILLIVFQNQSQPWYVWFLLIGGIVLGIIGGIMLAIALSQSSTCSVPLVDSCGHPIPKMTTQVVAQYPPTIPVMAPTMVTPITVPTTVPNVTNVSNVRPVVTSQVPTTVRQVATTQGNRPIVATVPVTASVPPSPNGRVTRVRTQQLQDETFEPDQEEYVIESHPEPIRTTVVGPYGPNGEQKAVTGVYRAPSTRTYVTSDIPEHPVTSNYSPQRRGPQTYPAQTVYQNY